MEHKLQISSSYKSILTFQDILESSGTLITKVLDIDFNAFYEMIFKVQNEEFNFEFGIQKNVLIVIRNNITLKIDLKLYPSLNNQYWIGVSWSNSTLSLSLKIINPEGEPIFIHEETETDLVIPSFSLISEARKLNLLPIIEYDSIQDFVNKVLSCLVSVQQKIEESGAYYSFWNVLYEGSQISERKPKKEIEIQPIIQSLLSDQCLMASIEIIPEYKSGAGDLDFLFIGRIKDRPNGYFCAEFKNAHSADLEKGLAVQLPTYLENRKTIFGAYCVLNYFGEWFPLQEKFIEKDILSFLYDVQRKAKNPLLKKIRILIFNLSKPNSASKKKKIK
jgi:hypothetical protein